MKNIKFIYIKIAVVACILFGCEEDDNDTTIILDGKIEGKVFFNQENINADRSSSLPLIVELRYQGSTANSDVKIPYTITIPGNNGAVEGEDFILPKTDFFVLRKGQAVTRVVLLQRILNNPAATQARSINFQLGTAEGITVGNDTNKGESITITINPGETEQNVDPHDPNDFIGDKKFSVSVEGTTLKIPFFSEIDDIRDTSNENIERVIIALHGSGRNARSQYENMLVAAQMETNQLDSILIIAPQFLEEEDIDNFVLDEEHLYWSSVGWRIGFNSRDEDSNPRPERISSYSIMDTLMVTLAKYPNLKTIVLTGHSAGAQFVNRYAASSPIPDQLIADGLKINFITNNPGSYVYLNDTRKVLGTENTFAVPTISCPDYNEYRYGLDDLPSYLRNIGGADVIRDRLVQRNVTYLIGQNDNDPNFEGFDDSCEAVLQGRDRFERATNYFKHLLDFYGPRINDTQKIEVVPGVGHSSRGMYQSETGRRNTFRN